LSRPSERALAGRHVPWPGLHAHAASAATAARAEAILGQPGFRLPAPLAPVLRSWAHMFGRFFCLKERRQWFGSTPPRRLLGRSTQPQHALGGVPDRCAWRIFTGWPPRIGRQGPQCAGHAAPGASSLQRSARSGCGRLPPAAPRSRGGGCSTSEDGASSPGGPARRAGSASERSVCSREAPCSAPLSFPCFEKAPVNSWQVFHLPDFGTGCLSRCWIATVLLALGGSRGLGRADLCVRARRKAWSSAVLLCLFFSVLSRHCASSAALPGCGRRAEGEACEPFPLF